MNFNNNNAFIEMCGYATHAGYAGDDYAIAMYGMHEAAADDPRSWESTVNPLIDPPGSNVKFVQWSNDARCFDADPANDAAVPGLCTYEKADLGNIDNNEKRKRHE